MTHRPTSLHTRTARHVAASRAVLLPVLVALTMLSAPGRVRDDQRGQSTVEYALILLGAAAIALVVVAWVTRTDAIGRLFDTVIGRVLQQAD
jgi:Flp pilus assembly pilin Flp